MFHNVKFGSRVKFGPRRAAAATLCVGLALTAGRGEALSLGGAFATDYSISSLGTPPSFVGQLGGLTFAPGAPNTLWIGDRANTSAGSIFAVSVVRDGDDRITGFGPGRSLVTTAPFIDGGVDFAPNGTLLYTTYSNNTIGQVKPGSVAPDRVDPLAILGVASSTGTLRFVPQGFAGEGSLKVASYSTSRWYDVEYALAPDGTYDLGTATLRASLSGGPEGIVYVKASNAGFDVDSVLISEYSANQVAAYEIDGAGDPIASTRRSFVTGLSGAEGATIDPLTGDFLFSTFGGGNNVVRVSGFTVLAPTGPGTDPEPPAGTGVIPVPAAAPLLALGLGLLGLLRRRRG